jgi:hypothetical protein
MLEQCHRCPTALRATVALELPSPLVRRVRRVGEETVQLRRLYVSIPTVMPNLKNRKRCERPRGAPGRAARVSATGCQDLRRPSLDLGLGPRVEPRLLLGGQGRREVRLRRQ